MTLQTPADAGIGTGTLTPSALAGGRAVFEGEHSCFQGGKSVSAAIPTCFAVYLTLQLFEQQMEVALHVCEPSHQFSGTLLQYFYPLSKVGRSCDDPLHRAQNLLKLSHN